MTTFAQRLTLFWLLMCICMMLHFNYNLSGLFYGIDLKVENASGTQPPQLIVLRLLFNIVPMAFAVALMYGAQRWLRWTVLIASALYVLAHAGHLAGELRHTPPDYSQWMLLTFTLLLAALQTFTAWQWLRQAE